MVRRLLIACLLLLPSPAYATTYYVAQTGGSDARSCMTAQTLGTPKLSINSGLGCLSAGDTLLIRAGTYNEHIESVTSGTSDVVRTRIANYNGETVWLKPTTAGTASIIIWMDCNCHYIDFDGLNMDGRGTSPTGHLPAYFNTANGFDPHHIRLMNAQAIAGTGHGSAAAVTFGGHIVIGATGNNQAINLTISGGGVPGGGCGFACNSYGVYLQGPNNLVDGCNIFATYGAGIQIYNASGDLATGNVIRNTIIHDVVNTESPGEYWGIIVIGPNTQIYNVLIYGLTLNTGNSGDAAVSIGCATGVCGDNTKLWNVTIYNSVNGGILIAGTTGVEARNNIVYGGGGTAFANTGTATTHTNSLDTGTNPLFVNPAVANFQLQEGSPGIDAGFTVATVTTDIRGIARPQRASYDIGAYEMAGAGGGSVNVSSGSDISWFWKLHHF